MGRAGRTRAFYRGLRDALTQHAQAQFTLARQLPDGHTEREHLLAMERATGIPAPELHLPVLPAGCKQLWDTFIELHNARGGTGMGGPLPIGWRDLQGWQDVRRVRLTPWEVDTLMAMDSVAVKTLSESKA